MAFNDDYLNNYETATTGNMFKRIGYSTAQGAQSGGIKGGIVGAATSILTSNKFLQDSKDKEHNAKLEYLRSIQDESSTSNTMSKATRQNTPYYALGGKLDANSSSSAVVDGNTHEQGGVQYGGVEVEDEEVIFGDKVYSNRLKYNGKTIAAIAKELTDNKGKLESKLATSDSASSNTITRQLQTLDLELNELFEIQGSMNGGNVPRDKAAMGAEIPPVYSTDDLYNDLFGDTDSRITNIPKATTITPDDVDSNVDASINMKRTPNTGDTLYPKGTLETTESRKHDNANIRAGVGAAASVATNIYLNERAKDIDIPEPIKQSNINLAKDINVDAIVQANANKVAEVNDFIKRNTSNSNVATAKMTNAIVKGMEKDNAVQMQKANMDTNLTNKEIMANVRIEQINNAMVTDYNQSQYLKDIQTGVTNPSQIAADAYNKSVAIDTNSQKRDYQERQLELQEQIYGNTAITTSLSTGDYTSVTTDNFKTLWMMNYGNRPKVTETLRAYAAKNNLTIDEKTGTLTQ